LVLKYKKFWEDLETMNKFLKGIGLAVVITMLTLSSLQARTGYVSDMLILTFRDGPGTTYTVLKTLKSNTPLTVLKEDQGYYMVRLTSGEEGWVDKQFVIFELPKALQVTKLEKEKRSLLQQLDEVKKATDSLKADLANRNTSAEEKATRLENRVKEMEKENLRLSRQLAMGREELTAIKAASADVIKTLESNKALTTENQRLSQSLAQMENQNSRLFRTGMIKWFLAGVGVLLLGWLIGVMLSGKQRRRGSLLD